MAQGHDGESGRVGRREAVRLRREGVVGGDAQAFQLGLQSLDRLQALAVGLQHAEALGVHEERRIQRAQEHYQHHQHLDQGQTLPEVPKVR
jgi:hypothetical protein